MTTSGVVGAVVLDQATLFEHVLRRCKLTPSVQTPEIVQTLRECLQFLINEYSNYGINLWCIKKLILGLHQYQEAYDLPTGIVDVLNVFLRTSPRVGGTVTNSDNSDSVALTDGDVTTYTTQTVTGGSFVISLSSAQAVRTVGILHRGQATRDLAFEVSNDGDEWSTEATIGSTVYVDGEWYWYDIDPAQSALYFRVRDTLANAPLSAYEFYASAGGTEIESGRLNRDMFTNLPQKYFQGRPLQYWFDRQVSQAVLHLWPSPNSIFDQYVVWYHRLIEDVGSDLTETIEIPQKWNEAVIAGLAAKAALELPGVNDARIPILQKAAQDALSGVEIDEVDNSPVILRPNIRPYTRLGGYGRR